MTVDWIAQLKHEDPRVRRQAATKLGNTGDRSAVVPLVTALKDRDTHIRHVADAAQFLNTAEQSFKSVELCMVSALGAQPSGRRLVVKSSSKRLLDPLLWMMEKSRPGYTQVFRRWRR